MQLKIPTSVVEEIVEEINDSIGNREKTGTPLHQLVGYLSMMVDVSYRYDNSIYLNEREVKLLKDYL